MDPSQRVKTGLPASQPTFTMPSLTKRRTIAFSLIVIVVISVAWIYWNRTTRADMSAWAAADSLAYLEVNDLADVFQGVEHTDAWRSLSGPVGAPPTLGSNRWWVRLARWTGIGSAEAILLSRSQVAVVFSGAQGAQDGSTLTIKPLVTVIIETHTSQRRMRSAVERHVEELARRVYRNPVFVRKQANGVELQEWMSDDASHQIVTTFVDTTVVVGNDEGSVLRSLDAHSGKLPSLQQSNDLNEVRRNLDSSNASAFGFVLQPGVKSFLQAYALYRSSPSADNVTAARIFADTFGSIVKSAGWTARFRDGMVEDRGSINLADGVADKMRADMSPNRVIDLTNLSFVPSEAQSISLYQIQDPASFWTDFNAVLSSHADILGSIAARPMLRGLLKSYGIDDADTFARSIGARLQTIRLEDSSPSVLIVEAYDRVGVKKSIAPRFGANPKLEKVDDLDLLLSSDNQLAAAFIDNDFLIGPVEAVRRCLATKKQSQSISSTEAFRRAAQVIDVSRPLTAITFTDDQHAAISFAETFTNEEGSPFSSNADAIKGAAKKLPYAVSVSMLKGAAIEWTSRSSFGIGGSFLVQLFPEKSR